MFLAYFEEWLGKPIDGVALEAGRTTSLNTHTGKQGVDSDWRLVQVSSAD